MYLIQTSRNTDGLFGWFTFERMSWMAAVLCAALGGFSIGNGHTTQSAVQNVSEQLGQKRAEVHNLQTQLIPKLASVAGCQQKRADIAEGDIAAPKGLLPCSSVAEALKSH